MKNPISLKNFISRRDEKLFKSPISNYNSTSATPLAPRASSSELITRVKRAFTKSKYLQVKLSLRTRLRAGKHFPTTEEPKSQDASHPVLDWSDMNISSTVETAIELTPTRAERSLSVTSQISTIITQTTQAGQPTPETTIPWRSSLVEYRSYERWVEEERLKAAMKRKSINEMNRASNGMTVFNARPISSLEYLHQSPVGKEDDERYVEGPSQPVTSSGQSSNNNTFMFPDTRPASDGQFCFGFTPIETTIPPTPVMTAGQVNFSLTTSLGRMCNIQEAEKPHYRSLSGPADAGIGYANRYAHLGNEPEHVSRAMAIANAEAILSAGHPSVPANTDGSTTTANGQSVLEWFTDRNREPDRPLRTLGQHRTDCGCCDTTPSQSSLIRTCPSPQVSMMQSSNKKHYSSAGILVAGCESVEAHQPLGWITSAEMVPVLIPKARAKPVTFFGRVWGRAFEVLLTFSENVVVVPAKEWDFQEEKWVPVRCRSNTLQK